MRRIRFLVAILIIWLFFFYNVERLSEPVDISRVAYIMVPFMAAITILAPRLRRVPLGVLLATPALLFVALKTWIGLPVWGTALPLTVTELCTIAVTTILARWVSNGVSEFECAINRITIGQIDELPEPFSTGQAKMYQEVKRARHYQRPLALMAVGIEEESIQVALDRIVQEVQQAMMKRYVLSDVARTLCDELEDYNIIAQGNNHFLALLPEVTPDQLPDLADRLCSTVSERVGVTLKIGTACFPEDSVTFESLVKKAVEEMSGKLEQESCVQPQRLATEHHIHSSIYKEESQWS